MTKKGPLGKAEKHYIESLCDTKTFKVIAHELDRAISLVEKHGMSYQKMRTKAGGQMARQGDERGGAVVMTESASMVSDDSRAEHRASVAKRPSCVTTIKKT